MVLFPLGIIHEGLVLGDEFFSVRAKLNAHDAGQFAPWRGIVVAAAGAPPVAVLGLEKVGAAAARNGFVPLVARPPDMVGDGNATGVVAFVVIHAS